MPLHQCVGRAHASRRLLAAGFAAASLIGGACGDTAQAPQPPKAFIRFIHAMPDTLGVDFRAVDIVENTPYIATKFRDIKQAGYAPVVSGQRHFREFLSDSTAPTAATVSTVLVDRTLDLVAGTHYTLAHVGFARVDSLPAAAFIVLEDTLPTPPAGQIAVRVMNLAAGLGSLDVYVTTSRSGPLPATPTFANVGYVGRTSYVNMDTVRTVTVPPSTTRIDSLFFRATVAGGGPSSPVLAVGPAPAGDLGSSSLDPIPGSRISGSVFTVYVFPRSTAGSRAPQQPTATFSNPAIIVVPDVQLHTRPAP